jgi:hypothetical protein
VCQQFSPGTKKNFEKEKMKHFSFYANVPERERER